MKRMLLGLFFLNHLYASTMMLTNEDRKQIDVTVYQQKFASIYEKRNVLLKKGENKLLVTDFSPSLSPNSLTIFSDDLTILSQFVDSKANNQLNLNLLSTETKTDLLGINYLAGKLSWDANYSMLLDQKNKTLKVTATAFVQNQSGIDYQQANLALIVGEVNTVDSFYAKPKPVMYDHQSQRKSAKVEVASYAPELKTTGSYYYRFEFPRLIDIKNNQVNQILLFSEKSVKYREKLTVNENSMRTAYDKDGSEKSLDANYILTFDNKKDNQLGLVFPEGDARVYQKDSDHIYFLGGAVLNAVAKDQEAVLDLGKSFNVLVKKKKIDFSIKKKEISSNNIETTTKSTYQVELINTTDQEQTLEYTDRFSQNWELLKENLDSTKISANQLKWQVKIPANTTKKIIYRILEVN